MPETLKEVIWDEERFSNCSYTSSDLLKALGSDFLKENLFTYVYWKDSLIH